MKLLYIVLLTSLLSFTQDDKKDLIQWSADYKLQWSDFMGKPSGALKAMTWSTIKVDDFKADASTVTLKVSASFLKKQSWKKPDANDADLLAHEQTHFDITEIYARKLRKKISDTKYKSAKDAAAQVGKFSNEIFSESGVEQKKYDAETNHSINKDAQQKWNKNVAAQLQSLNAYSATELNLTIK